MKHFPFFIALSLFCTFTGSYSQQTDSLVVKIKDNQNVHYQFCEPIFSNPASYLTYRKYNLTSFSMEKEVSKRATSLAQEGKDKESVFFQAKAYNRLDENSAVWGGASYRQGRNKEVHWNESADYELLFPYVVADSVGGDIRYEHYEIQGGYVQRLGNYNLGISGFYKARMEYRTIDPRPKNIAAQVGGILGINRDLSNKITAGVQVNIEKYTQKHKMSFYSPTGFPVIYEMNGMGNFNNMLKGKRREAFYDGWSYGTGIQLYEKEAQTWFLTAGLTTFTFEKLLPEFYDVQVSKAKHLSYAVTAGKMVAIDQMKLGVVLRGTKEVRKGTENLFINQTTTNFVKISQEERYQYEESRLHFRGIWNYAKENNDYSLLPFLAFSQQTERYKQPQSKTDIHSLEIGIQGQWMHTFANNSLLTLRAYWLNKQNTKEQSIFSFGESQAINQMLLSDYAIQIADYWEGNTNIRYDFKASDALAVFIVGEYRYQHFQKYTNNSSFFVRLGITF